MPVRQRGTPERVYPDADTGLADGIDVDRVGQRLDVGLEQIRLVRRPGRPRRIEADAPATFLYSQTYAFVVNRRFSDVAIRPESSWSSVWRWKVSAAPAAGGAGN